MREILMLIMTFDEPLWRTFKWSSWSCSWSSHVYEFEFYYQLFFRIENENLNPIGGTKESKQQHSSSLRVANSAMREILMLMTTNEPLWPKQLNEAVGVILDRQMYMNLTSTFTKMKSLNKRECRIVVKFIYIYIFVNVEFQIHIHLGINNNCNCVI
jgi:hypothetical protein